VAQHKEKGAMPRKNPLRWIHANGEDTGLPSKSFDLVSLAFVVCFFFSSSILLSFTKKGWVWRNELVCSNKIVKAFTSLPGELG